MKYKICIPEDKTYVHIRVEKPINKSLVSELLSEMAKIIKEHEINRFFIDARKASFTMSAFDEYDIAYKETKQLGLGFKIAFLRCSSDNSYSFMETLAQNAGLNIRFFTDVNDAETWLEE